MTKNEIDTRTRTLAYHLWRSAGQDYGRTVDFWIMAEQMVVELAVAAARLSGAAVESASAATGLKAPRVAASYVRQINELAFLMWEGAGWRYGEAVDNWLSAERHVMTMAMTAGQRDRRRDPEPDADEPTDSFSAEAYLEQIRTTAYYMWEAAGRQYGGAMDFWLAAERRVLDGMAAAAAAHAAALESEEERDCDAEQRLDAGAGRNDGGGGDVTRPRPPTNAVARTEGSRGGGLNAKTDPDGTREMPAAQPDAAAIQVRRLGSMRMPE